MPLRCDEVKVSVSIPDGDAPNIDRNFGEAAIDLEGRKKTPVTCSGKKGMGIVESSAGTAILAQ